MLFNTLDFAIFLPIVFLVYWFITHKSLNLQNFWILLTSYVFYGWWDWRFLFLIAFSTLVDYALGLSLANSQRSARRKLLLGLSIGVNLGLLGFFKYYNFFIENFISVFSFFGLTFNIRLLHIILPVGISFYTFQTLSYTLDIYRGRLEPTRNFIAFAAFISFFPQLVAGPIERANNLLPQFLKPRKFEYHQAVEGTRQILWGLFKKVAIADNCALYVDQIFYGYTEYSGSTLLLGAIFFAFQIYGDFSGYSDIAIGTARLFGINLMRNFAFPYFSQDIAEFWRRWHISLSTWFRDYLYIPLGGSRGGTWMSIRNVFIIFLVSGFWHGANWTFILWGGLHASFFLPLLLTNKNRKNLDIVAKGRYFPNLRELFNMLSTFALTTLAWVFFRADSVSIAYAYLSEIFSASILHYPEIRPRNLMIFLGFFLMIEWLGRSYEYALAIMEQVKFIGIRWACYFLLILIIFYLTQETEQFIYFQF